MNKRTKPAESPDTLLDAAAQGDNPDTLQGGESTLPPSEPAPAAAPVPVSAIGLPLDEFHGKGGVFVMRDGVRTLKTPAP